MVGSIFGKSNTSLHFGRSWVRWQRSPSRPWYMLNQACRFDVFLSNSRCNQISMSHVRYTPSDAQFWDWSVDQMAQFDVPAVVGKVLSVSGASTLSWIGHSQGTTIAFAALSRNYDDLNARINLFVSLAPVVFLKSSPSILFNVLATLGVDKIFQLLGVNEFLPNNDLVDKLLPGFCKLFPSSCNFFVCLLAGTPYRAFTSNMYVNVRSKAATRGTLMIRHSTLCSTIFLLQPLSKYALQIECMTPF